MTSNAIYKRFSMADEKDLPYVSIQTARNIPSSQSFIGLKTWQEYFFMLFFSIPNTYT